MSIRASFLAALALSFASGCATTPEADRRRAELEAQRLRLSANVVSDPGTQARIEAIACRVDETMCRDFEIFVLRQNRPHADVIGRVLRISVGMLKAAGSDDALAFVIGHEIAHARLKHAPAADASRATALEIEADAEGLRLMREAGYDASAATGLLARILARERASSNPSKAGIRQLEKRRNALARLP